MVTTRRGTETPGMEPTPRSSASKKRIGKRELDSLDTPTQTKRQRKAAVPEVDETPKAKTSPLAIRRRSSPQVVVATPASDDAVFETPDQGPASVYETPATRRKVVQGSPTPKAKGRTPASLRQSTLPDEVASSTQEESNADDDDNDDIEDDDATPIGSPATGPAPATAHVRFGSEEPTINAQGHKRYEAPASTSAPEPAIQEEDDDDASDSDEAPEVVTAASATSRAKAADADATRARQAQQEKERLKREARSARIAEEQAAKAARAEKKAAKLAKLAARAQKSPSPAPVSFSALPTSLPALLPTALLDTIDDVRPPTPPPQRAGKTDEERRREKLNHHIKFLERTEKPAKDVKKGKLSVAVLAQQSRVLPPKVSRDARNVREHWLKGRRAEKSGKVKGPKGRLTKGKVERRGGGGGFLRGED